MSNNFVLRTKQNTSVLRSTKIRILETIDNFFFVFHQTTNINYLCVFLYVVSPIECMHGTGLSQFLLSDCDRMYVCGIGFHWIP